MAKKIKPKRAFGYLEKVWVRSIHPQDDIKKVKGTIINYANFSDIKDWYIVRFLGKATARDRYGVVREDRLEKRNGKSRKRVCN